MIIFIMKRRLRIIMTLFRTHNIKHILNVATGINIFREDKDIVEKKVELLDVPEQNIDKGGETF